ncbi:hypothetical protein [uncultured Acinetobacter sp.]|uniref:hypothetical protein n=1 Tax=uncultured Acinetobacter sp. TaxID=165433 RepID=UPI00258A3061|nr:hypothetical protein [uncultured Acinetobacter sp.]
MARITLKDAVQAIGIGKFVEKTIKFHDSFGNEVKGEILIKVVSHDDIVNSTDVLGIDFNKMTVDQLNKARLLEVVYSDEDNKFFSDIKSTGTISTEALQAIYDAADEVLDFSGKLRKLAKNKSSGVNSSSMESLEEQ